MKNLVDTDNPLVIPVSFAILRERARRRKEAGGPWPYVSDPILAGPRSFTNVRREHDKTTKWAASNLRDDPTSIVDAPNRPAALVLYRLFNLIQTGETFFISHDGRPSAFEEALTGNSVRPLQIAILHQPKPHVSNAYTIASLNNANLDKAEGLLANYAPWLRNQGHHGWRRQFERWAQSDRPPRLVDVFEWFLSEMTGKGVGSFVAGQFVADLKYREPFCYASDWSGWATSGPGSRRGLNLVLERDPTSAWNEREWLRELQWLQGVINPRLEALGDEPLHAQDVQNVLCDGVWKTHNFNQSGEPITSKGSLKSEYRPSLDCIPESEAAFHSRLEEVYEADRADLLKAGVGERNVAIFAELLGEANSSVIAQQDRKKVRDKLRVTAINPHSISPPFSSFASRAVFSMARHAGPFSTR
jgi:hypothetical protein